MIKKRGMIEFSWVFALIIGAVVLFLAFYFIGGKMTEKQVFQSSETEHSLDILLNPFSSFGGLGTTSGKVIELNKVQRIGFSCDSSKDLGHDSLNVLGDSGDFSEKKIYDKYIFSEAVAEERNFQIISKPFLMPWRVVDLIYFIPKNITYCFVKLNNIDKEFGVGPYQTGMNISNFKFVSTKSECFDEEENEESIITVCESYSGCDVNIDYGQGKITKASVSGAYYFSGDVLMYGAIFSDLSIYNCNLKRLAKRINYQADVYAARLSAVGARCQGQSTFSLGAIKQASEQLSVSNGIEIKERLNSLKIAADAVNSQNSAAVCHLY